MNALKCRERKEVKIMSHTQEDAESGGPRTSLKWGKGKRMKIQLTIEREKTWVVASWWLWLSHPNICVFMFVPNVIGRLAMYILGSFVGVKWKNIVKGKDTTQVTFWECPDVWMKCSSLCPSLINISSYKTLSGELAEKRNKMSLPHDYTLWQLQHSVCSLTGQFCTYKTAPQSDITSR